MGKLRAAGLIAIACAVAPLSGCHYYQEYRIKRATANLRYAMAELIEEHRRCLVRQEPTGRAGEICAGYATSLRDLSMQMQIESR